MPVGPILCLLLIVLVWSGLLDGPLTRMRLSRRAVLVVFAAALVGSVLDLDVGPGLRLNSGATLVPLVFSLWLLASADHVWEPVRTILGSLLAAVGIFAIGQWFPPGQPTELNLFWLDAQYLYALIGAVAGCLLAKTWRTAFCAAALGALFADMAHYVLRESTNLAEHTSVIQIGGGGFQGTALIAGVLATTLALVIGTDRNQLSVSTQIESEGTDYGETASATAQGGGDTYARDLSQS